MNCKSARLLCPWDFSGKNSGVTSHSLLQGIFPTQGLNPGLQHCMRILCHLSLHGTPSDALGDVQDSGPLTEHVQKNFLKLTLAKASECVLIIAYYFCGWIETFS